MLGFRRMSQAGEDGVEVAIDALVIAGLEAAQVSALVMLRSAAGASRSTRGRRASFETAGCAGLLRITKVGVPMAEQRRHRPHPTRRHAKIPPPNRTAPPMTIVDLSIPLYNDVPADPPYMKPAIEYVAHDEGAEQIAAAFPGLEPEQLPDGKGWAVERVQISTHNGTHLDAPWHYHPTMDGGERAITIDEVPLDWCMRPGREARLPRPARRPCRDAGRRSTPSSPASATSCSRSRSSLRQHRARGRASARPTTSTAAAASGATRRCTSWRRACGSSAPTAGAGTRRSATRPQRFAETGDASLIWEGHKAGRERGYCQLEKLHNLEALPADRLHGRPASP